MFDGFRRDGLSSYGGADYFCSFDTSATWCCVSAATLERMNQPVMTPATDAIMKMTMSHGTTSRTAMVLGCFTSCGVTAAFMLVFPCPKAFI